MNNNLSHQKLSHTQQEVLLELWDEAVGGGMSEGDDMSRILSRTLKRANECLNATGRYGQMSLFLRETFKDRIDLVASTVPDLNPGGKPFEGHFTKRAENFDDQELICYYELFDQLLPAGSDAFSDECRRRRGTTGWIALTGCPLMLIGKQPKEVIRLMFPPDQGFMCLLHKYGHPLSGGRISESLAKHSEAGMIQYLGAPVLSISNKNMPMGVVRYAAPLAQPFVESSDLEFLKRIAHLFAVIIHHFILKKRNSRQIQFSEACSRFERSGNFHEFLEFAAESLSSKIASVYVAIRLGNQVILRLVDAYGIIQPISELRQNGKVLDYSATNPGITWNLFSNANDDLRVVVVKDDTGWAGRNTMIFYQPAFSSRFKREVCNDVKELERIVKTYLIKLIGSRLRASDNGKSIGAFKVEFPITFDTEDSYGDSDQQFFRECRECLGREIDRLSAFINGDWFAADSKENLQEFVRLLATTVSVNLVSASEKPEFWQSVIQFIDNNPEVKSMFRASIRNRLQFHEIPKGEGKKYIGELLKTIPTEIIHILLEKGADMLFHNSP